MAENVILVENTLTTQFLDVYGVYGFTIPFDGDFSEFPLTLGDECVVVWDGVEYTVTVGDSSAIIADTMFVGNGSAFGLPGNNEPFVIAWDTTGATFIALTDTSETSHAVEIYQVVSNDIVLKDRHGNDLEGISGAAELRVPTTDGGFRSFTAGERVKTTINPNFSNGDMVVTPNNGEVFSEVTVKKPEGLVPGAIAKDVVVAGIVGEYEGGSDDGFTAMLERTIVDLVAPDVTLANSVCRDNNTLKTANVYSVGKYCFNSCPELVSVTINGESMSIDHTFTSCYALESFYAPNLTGETHSGTNNYTFQYCSSLKTFYAPNFLFGVGSGRMFQNCTALTEFISTRTDGYHSFGDGMFFGCTSLQKVDIAANLMLNNGYIFNNCTALTTIIMRGGRCFAPSGDVTSTFVKNCPAIFYVPSAVYSDYEANTKWKTFIDAGRLFCIEDYPDICG